MRPYAQLHEGQWHQTTRKNWLRLNYFEDPPELDAELQAEIPTEELVDDVIDIRTRKPIDWPRGRRAVEPNAPTKKISIASQNLRHPHTAPANHEHRQQI
jgi:hypothetical protein